MEGQGGRAPLMAASAPHFVSPKITFLKYHAMTRQQTMMEKEIISGRKITVQK